MKEIGIIFPNQLFEDIDFLNNVSEVYLIESPLFFYDSKIKHLFHKKKLLLHRASMKCYEDFLKTKKKLKVNYIDFFDAALKDVFKEIKGSKVHCFDPVDFVLEKRIKKYSKLNDIDVKFHENLSFISTKSDINEYFEKNKFNQTSFYIWQRKRFKILVDKDLKPVNSKWTFDTENRKKLPKNVEVPQFKDIKENEYVIEAKKYVNKNFPKHYGDVENFNYPVGFADAKKLLKEFLNIRLNNYGPYQDSITAKDPFVFHSLLSSSINSGLLTPQYVINETLKFYSNNKDINYSSLEGFIRQILGWREYMRAVYVLKGVEIRTTNFWKFKKKLPKSFWTAKTGIEPIDDCIKKALKYAYNHHIERLMLLGNFMLLCQFDPDKIYDWFMEMFIDAYDWVMVPNVYSMSQFADGGLITSKPYISSSNYVSKMSDYKKGDWAEVWDNLYWNFVIKFRKYFESNPRTSIVKFHLSKFSDKKISDIKKFSNNFLNAFNK